MDRQFPIVNIAFCVLFQFEQCGLCAIFMSVSCLSRVQLRSRYNLSLNLIMNYLL